MRFRVFGQCSEARSCRSTDWLFLISARETSSPTRFRTWVVSVECIQSFAFHSLRSERLPSLGEHGEEFGMIECLRFISYIFSFTILCLLFVSKCGNKLRNTQRTHLGDLYELGDTSCPSSHS